jgi:hypothetical protein
VTHKQEQQKEKSMKKYLAILFAGFVSHAWAGYDQGSGNSCSAHASDCGAAYNCSAPSFGSGQNSLCDTISSYCSYTSGLNYYNCYQPATICDGGGNGNNSTASCSVPTTFGGGDRGGGGSGGGDCGTPQNHCVPDLAGTAWLFGGAWMVLTMSRRRLAMA